MLDRPCQLHGGERANRVRALVALAEQAEQPDEIGERLAEVDSLWTRPDAELPLTKRIEALREP